VYYGRNLPTFSKSLLPHYQGYDMMEAESTSETSSNFYQTTQCDSPEDSHLYIRYPESFRSHETESY
jgi:hypothetical protein